MIGMCDIEPHHTLLDPCAGSNRVFVNNFPKENIKYYAEIEEGLDFFNVCQKMDWIIGNPPYSKWDAWIDKTVSGNLCDKFCYIMTFMNFTQKRLARIHHAGFGLTKMHLCKVDWFFSPSIICVFERDKPSIISYTEDTIQCECGRRCGRGRTGNDPNVCISCVSYRSS